MALLGFDVGSSSVKASLVDEVTGKCISSSFFPKNEAPILSRKPGWAEQEPSAWWEYLTAATRDVMSGRKEKVTAIGISYQMHGLVCIDKGLKELRPSIIWCDSRAVPYGEKAFESIGGEKCLSHLLNSPGNFTAAKLAWVKENEPELFDKIYKIMLPGDYIAMRLTGEVNTTIGGLSEGMMWDFKEKRPAGFLLDEFGFPGDILPTIVPTFGEQGRLSRQAAAELGLSEGIPVAYRAGDQPNNALSLNVLRPGEIASTAGTSGVVYGVGSQADFDPLSRVNCVAQVNYTPEDPRIGVLLCINGTGILNSWIKRNVAPEGMSYADMDKLAAGVPVGSDGLVVLPFGNGAERVLGNKDTGCKVSSLNFNVHTRAHLMRAAQEGIVFSFQYGIDIMESLGIKVSRIHAGKANMFLSDIFRQTLANVSGATIELLDTDGAAGAAKGAGIGAGIYRDADEAFSSLEKLATIEPDPAAKELTAEAYGRWKDSLNKEIK